MGGSASIPDGVRKGQAKKLAQKHNIWSSIVATRFDAEVSCARKAADKATQLADSATNRTATLQQKLSDALGEEEPLWLQTLSAEPAVPKCAAVAKPQLTKTELDELRGEFEAAEAHAATAVDTAKEAHALLDGFKVRKPVIEAFLKEYPHALNQSYGSGGGGGDGDAHADAEEAGRAKRARVLALVQQTQDTVCRGDAAALSALLLTHKPEARTLINAPNELGWTAVLLAASRGHAAVVVVLIKFGADLDYRSAHGESALFVACQSGGHEVVAALLTGGADISLLNTGGSSPFIAAAFAGHCACLKALVAFAAKRGRERLRAKMRSWLRSVGNFSLSGAPDAKHIAHRHVQLVQCLNGMTAEGQTAVMVAAREGHTQAVVILYEAGADVTLISPGEGGERACAGFDALMLAADAGHADVVRKLLGIRHAAAGRAMHAFAKVNGRSVAHVGELACS
jgi:ankyrin repeat protein